jgi:chromate transport protein ChrA
MIETLITLIVFILVCALILYIVSWILSLLPIPTTVRNIILALIAVIMLIAALRQFNVFASLDALRYVNVL